MKVDRLISIIMVLLEHKKIGAKALSEMFEVSIRTIYRDIDTINMAGIPIVSSPGINGGFHIMDEYKVDKKVFTTSDMATLLMGLGSISSMITSEEIVNTLAKVKSLIPAEQVNDIELKSSQITIDLKPWMGNEDIQLFLVIIKTALQKQILLSFQYADRKGNFSQRKIEPYRLVLKSNHWYVQGFCLEQRDFRLFKLSRISNLIMLDETFILRELPMPISEFTDIMAKKQTKVKLLVHESALEHVRDYCSSGHIEPHEDNHYIVHFPFIEDDFGYNLLFSFGDKCECLEPLEVRNEMIRRIENFSKLYTRNTM